MKMPTMNYYDWYQELKRVALVAGFTARGVKNTDFEVFSQYYVDGYTPAEAMLEDMSYT